MKLSDKTIEKFRKIHHVKTIDKFKYTCYQKLEKHILAFVVEPEHELSKKRLSSALNLILSEKDIEDYFEKFRTLLKNN